MGKHNMIHAPRIGEVYLMNFGTDKDGSEQCGMRPGVVFQNNVGNKYSPNVIALPLTSSLKKLGQPTHVLVRANGSGLRVDSIVLCENPECISKDRVGKYITTLSGADMRRVIEASLLATSAISLLDLHTLLRTWKAAASLNL